MLVPKYRKKVTTANKPIAFRISPIVVDEFRRLCKEKGVVQSSIIENAMLIAIKELKELSNEK
jgi:hypothetical protein